MHRCYIASLEESRFNAMYNHTNNIFMKYHDTVSALQSRWKRYISPSVAKFLSAMETAERLEPEISGDTDGSKRKGVFDLQYTHL